MNKSPYLLPAILLLVIGLSLWVYGYTMLGESLETYCAESAQVSR